MPSNPFPSYPSRPPLGGRASPVMLSRRPRPRTATAQTRGGGRLPETPVMRMAGSVYPGRMSAKVLLRSFAGSWVIFLLGFRYCRRQRRELAGHLSLMSSEICHNGFALEAYHDSGFLRHEQGAPSRKMAWEATQLRRQLRTREQEFRPQEGNLHYDLPVAHLRLGRLQPMGLGKGRESAGADGEVGRRLLAFRPLRIAVQSGDTIQHVPQPYHPWSGLG